MSTIREAYNKRFDTPTGIEGELSTLDRIQLFPLPSESLRDEFLQLANTMLSFKPSGRGAVVVFASTVAGEGTSFVSYNACRELAHTLNRQVAWIDANFRSPQPRLHLLGETTFADMLRDPELVAHVGGGTKLALVSGGMDLADCVSHLVSDRYPAVLRAFTQRFDFTVLDCPPILNSVETELFSSRADGLIAVIEKSRLKWEVIKAGLDQLTAKRVNILGTVFNRRTYDLPKAIYDRL